LTPPGSFGGTVGSNVDQPAVWHRAQFSSNSNCPSCTFWRRRTHSFVHASAAWSALTVAVSVVNVPHATAAFRSDVFDGWAVMSAMMDLQSDASSASDASGLPSALRTAAREVASVFKSPGLFVLGSPFSVASAAVTASAAAVRAVASAASDCFFASADVSWIERM
jgi:hypothetical protein